MLQSSTGAREWANGERGPASNPPHDSQCTPGAAAARPKRPRWSCNCAKISTTCLVRRRIVLRSSSCRFLNPPAPSFAPMFGTGSRVMKCVRRPAKPSGEQQRRAGPARAQPLSPCPTKWRSATESRRPPRCWRQRKDPACDTTRCIACSGSQLRYPAAPRVTGWRSRRAGLLSRRRRRA